MSHWYPVIDVSSQARDLVETMGTKRKFWFTSTDDTRWLFKYSRPETGEHWSEKVAAEIGTQTVDAVFGQLSTVEPPTGSPSTLSAADCFVGYLLLDALIGNGDRHHENGAERRLIVTWKSDVSKGILPVAELIIRVADPRFRFGYLEGAREAQYWGFQPFLAFPSLEARYESRDLFPFLANRVLPTRPDYLESLTAVGLDGRRASFRSRTPGWRRTATARLLEPRSRSQATRR